MAAAQIGDLKREELVAKVRAAEKAIEYWNDDREAPTELIQGRLCKILTLSIEEHWRAIRGMIATERVEESARKLVLSLDSFFAAYDTFSEQAATEGAQVDPGGTEELWLAWSAVVADSAPIPPKRRIESISELTTGAVVCTPSQIAVIYEWYTPQGAPDVDRVRREMAEPGSEFNPETHKTGAQKRAEKRLAEQWDARSSRVRSAPSDFLEPGVSRRSKIAKESVEELLRQRVGSKQIAMMKGISEDDVKRIAWEIGEPVNGIAAGPPLSAEQHLTQVRQREAQKIAQAKAQAQAIAPHGKQNPAPEPDPEPVDEPVNTYSELDNMAEQVRQMFFDGHSAERIHEAIKGQHEVSRAAVRSLVRGFKEEAESV